MIAASVGNEFGSGQPTSNLALLGNGDGGHQLQGPQGRGRQGQNYQHQWVGGGTNQPMNTVGGRGSQPSPPQHGDYGYGPPDHGYGSDDTAGFDPVTVARGDNGFDHSGFNPATSGYPDYGRYGDGNDSSQQAGGHWDVSTAGETMSLPKRGNPARRRTVRDGLADYAEQPKDIPAPLPRHRRTR